MTDTFKNKVALVTGGSTGIGRGTALRLAEQGAKVVVTGRNEATLKEAADQHQNIEYVVADTSSPADVERTLDSIRKNHDRLDILVNNAGIAPAAPLELSTPDHVASILDVNVAGLIETTRQALPLLRSSKGSIVNTASAVVDSPMPGLAVYSASKGAVVGLTRAWAKELAGDGIRVNAVNPGPIETPIFDKMGIPAEAKEEMAGQIAASVPLGRFGTVDEVASLITFLASPAASYVTGAQFNVAGGYGA